jgi:hypothetical protein
MARCDVPETARDLGICYAVLVQPFDRVGLVAYGWLAAFVFAGGPGGGDAFALACQHDLALELRDGANDCQDNRYSNRLSDG